MVRRILSLWSGPWPLVKHLLVVLVAEIYAVMACSAPAYAFQISSATGYARVVSQAAQQAYIASHRAQVISSLAPAISAAGAGSVAVRAVAGPIGWASLAVSAGLVIAGMLYTNQEIQQVKNNAAMAAGVEPVIYHQRTELQRHDFVWVWVPSDHRLYAVVDTAERDVRATVRHDPGPYVAESTARLDGTAGCLDAAARSINNCLLQRLYDYL